jgi:hypothetical protein
MDLAEWGIGYGLMGSCPAIVLDIRLGLLNTGLRANQATYSPLHGHLT